MSNSATTHLHDTVWPSCTQAISHVPAQSRTHVSGNLEDLMGSQCDIALPAWLTLHHIAYTVDRLTHKHTHIQA